MCLAIPGRVIAFPESMPDMATVDVSGVRRNINVGLVLPDGLEIGDWVLIHVGFALSRIDELEARRTDQMLRELGDLYQQELEQLGESGSP